MKFFIQASSGTALCQKNDLVAGLESLNHVSVADWSDPDTAFVFVGNGPYDSWLNACKVKKTIFNVLDVPWHVPEVNVILSQLREQLPLAGRTTTISKTIASELLEFCGIKAEVIYYPMKDVKYTGVKKYPQFRAAIVGRVGDPNKRAQIAVRALIKAGFEESEVAIIGPESCGYGVRMGEVSVETLNDIYNSVDYVFMCSKTEGIGLTAIEGAICGAIPIVLPDLSTFDEFWVESPLGLHYQKMSNVDDVAALVRSIDDDKEWKGWLKLDFRYYGERYFRPLFDRKKVAKRIVSVYQTL